MKSLSRGQLASPLNTSAGVASVFALWKNENSAGNPAPPAKPATMAAPMNATVSGNASPSAEVMPR